VFVNLAALSTFLVSSSEESVMRQLPENYIPVKGFSVLIPISFSEEFEDCPELLDSVS